MPPRDPGDRLAHRLVAGVGQEPHLVRAPGGQQPGGRSRRVHWCPAMLTPGAGTWRGDE